MKWDLAEQAGIPKYIDLSKPDNVGKLGVWVHNQNCGTEVVPNKSLGVPQGLSQVEFDNFSGSLRGVMQSEGLPAGKTFVHGSRAAGTAKPGISDIDVVHVVSDEDFASLVARRLEQTTGRNRQIIQQNAELQVEEYPELWKVIFGTLFILSCRRLMSQRFSSQS